MKTFYVAAAFGGAVLLAAANFANAQGTGTGSSSSGTATNQCWDLSNNVVRDRSGTNATGPSGNRDSTVGSTTPGSGTAATGSSGTSSNANATARPAGMPNC